MVLHRERLQPSLLDRLTDDLADRTGKGSGHGVMSSAELRRAVLRDLNWLLNTVRVESLLDLSDLTYARRSTLNYGIPDLAGRTVSGLEPKAVADSLRRAILDFEPRLIADSVRIKPEPGSAPNALSFRIEAELWAQPVPLQLWLRTELDLDSGDVSVSEMEERDLDRRASGGR